MRLDLRPRDNRTPGERITALKAADMDPATAAPTVVVVGTEDVADGIRDLAGIIGDAVADRRWLVALVDRLLYAAEQSTRYAESTEAQGTDIRQTTETGAYAAGFTAGVNHVADALAAVMNASPPGTAAPADHGLAAAARRAVGAGED